MYILYRQTEWQLSWSSKQLHQIWVCNVLLLGCDGQCVWNVIFMARNQCIFLGKMSIYFLVTDTYFPILFCQTLWHHFQTFLKLSAISWHLDKLWVFSPNFPWWNTDWKLWSQWPLNLHDNISYKYHSGISFFWNFKTFCHINYLWASRGGPGPPV